MEPTNQEKVPTLDETQLGILSRIAKGEAQEKLAADLGLNPSQFNRKVTELRQRLGARSTLEAVLIANRFRLIRLDELLKDFDSSKVGDISSQTGMRVIEHLAINPHLNVTRVGMDLGLSESVVRKSLSKDIYPVLGLPEGSNKAILAPILYLQWRRSAPI